jgi:hypothetical protein
MFFPLVLNHFSVEWKLFNKVCDPPMKSLLPPPRVVPTQNFVVLSPAQAFSVTAFIGTMI